MGARFSAPVQPGPGSHPASCTMGTRSFPGGKEWPGCDADPSPPSSAVGHERVEPIPLLPLWAVRPVQSLSACTRVHFTFTVELYLYSPYGPYGLYRASVHVQGCTLSLPYTFRKNIAFRKVVCLYQFELLVRSEPE